MLILSMAKTNTLTYVIYSIILMYAAKLVIVINMGFHWLSYMDGPSIEAQIVCKFGHLL